MVIGYFSLLDLGLGRAVTKFVAELLVSPDSGHQRLVWTAWYLMAGVGVVGGVLLASFTPWLVHSAVKVPLTLQRETERAFFLLACSVPVVVLTTGFRGLLEAAQRFGATSLIKIPTGILSFVLPLVLVRVTVNLPTIILSLVLLRLAGAVAYFLMCRTLGGTSASPQPFHRESARALLQFGLWMTVSNIVSPLMVGADRFVVGALVSLAAVTYYATPFEAVSKLLLVPTALAAVLFPAFSTASVANPIRLQELTRAGYRVLFLVMYPVAFALVAFAPELLDAWLGRQFALQSTTVLRWLTVGVLANSLAAVPFAMLQGLGRSDLTAKIHVIELPIYAALLIGLIHQFGIVGAAMAWTTRTTLDLLILFIASERQLSRRMTQALTIGAPVVLLLALLGIGAFVTPTGSRAAILAGVLLASGVLAWRWTERTRLALR
jgi:O-antigen/teichoic acid export membrane protein